MSHINFNHLYYFWQVCKAGSVVGAAAVLNLTPQTITGQIKALEERLQGKLFKRQGRGLVPSELGQLVLRYADKMFLLNQEMLDIVTWRKEPGLLFNVGVAGGVSRPLVSQVLHTVMEDEVQLHLRCTESTHDTLLEQLSQQRLDMILSDCPLDATPQPGLISVKLGESRISFFCHPPLPDQPFPACLERRKLLIPGPGSRVGRHVRNWMQIQGLEVQILGEFTDAALMKAVGERHNAIYVASYCDAKDTLCENSRVELGKAGRVVVEYYMIFAERMLQHPAVQRLCNKDFTALFAEGQA